MKSLTHKQDQAELLRRLRAVRPDSRARWGRMSARQMVCHLGDAFRMATGEKVVRRTGGLWHRTLLRWVVLYLPLPWPRGVPTSPELDQLGQGTRPADFDADVARVEALVAQVTAPARRFAWQAHPLFGPLSTAAWLRWGYRHMDHHLRQFGV